MKYSFPRAANGKNLRVSGNGYCLTGTGGLEQNIFSDLSSLEIVVPKQKKEKIVAQSNSSMCSRDTVMNTIWKKGLLDPAIQLVSSGHGQMGVECECELPLRYRDLTSTGFSPGGSQGMSSLGLGVRRHSESIWVMEVPS